MTRSRWIAALLAAALALVALPALAGGKEGHCKEDTQSCLNHMASMLKGRGWLGIEYDYDDAKPTVMTVKRVIPGSPAEAAGFQAGDLLVTVNGVKFSYNTEEKCVTCEATKEHWVPGAKAAYVVSRGGKEVSLNATLAAMPPDVMAQMVGNHMIEHATVDVASKK